MNSFRKRKFNWDDVYQSSSEDERQIIKRRLLEANFNANARFQSSSDDDEDDDKHQEEEEDAGCVLCGHLKYGGCDIGDNIENSQHTYADVLQKLFSRSSIDDESEDDVSFDAGKLCTICKVKLQNLYRLQRELREEKSQIISIYKESQNVRKERKIDKNVSQILKEMKNIRQKQEQSRNNLKKKMFKNKSDSLLDYSTQNSDGKVKSLKQKTPQKTPEQNKSNIKRFTIQSLKRRKGDRYLIKWDGFSDEENTWEMRSAIPEYILKYYEDDPERLGLPAPTIPDKFNPVMESSGRESDEESSKDATENYDISSIIDGLYKDQEEKVKITLKKGSSSNFYVDERIQSNKPLKKRYPTNGRTSNSSNRVPTKAALKHSDDDLIVVDDKTETNAFSASFEMKNLLKEEQEVNNFNISFDRSSKDDSHNKSDVMEESPQAINDKDNKKTKLLGKIFVSTPERKRSQDYRSEEMIKAVLQEEDIYTIESLIAKKGSKYLVKWENYPHDQNTWEPRSAIPPFIVKYYEQDMSRLGKPVPAPPSPESEYIPAVDSIAEDTDGDYYERDDDWKPKDKKRRRKSGSTSGKKGISKAANNDSINSKEKEVKTPKRKDIQKTKHLP